MSHTAVDEFVHAGLTVEIHYDETADDPRDRDEECKTAIFVLDHNRYTLANEADEIYPLDTYGGWAEVEAAIREEYPDVVALQPVWGYDHSGLSITAGERTYPFADAWDSGQLGFVFITAAKMDSGWGAGQWDTDKALEAIKAEVEEYGEYLSGECYGYVVKDRDDETLDSCWGFLGSDYVVERAKEAAQGEADYLVSEAWREAQRLLEALDSPDLATALAAAKQTVSQ